MRKSVAEAVAALDAMAQPSHDPEQDHADADKVLLDIAPIPVREAYMRLVARSKWWACA